MPISVTQVLDHLTEPELLNWYLNKGKTACAKISDESKRIGSAVDLMIQQDIKGEGYTVPNSDLAIVNCMGAWEKFKKAYPEYLGSIINFQEEITDGEIIGHPDIELADQIDDIKTSRSIQPKHWTQTGKYASIKKKNWIGIIRLDKETGEFEYKRQGIEVIEYENRIFDAYLLLYKHNMTIREIVRQQLELEVLNVSPCGVVGVSRVK